MFRRVGHGIAAGLLGASIVLAPGLSSGAAAADGAAGRARTSGVQPDDPWWDFQSLVDVSIPEAWERTTGSSAVTVAVVDTGVTAMGDLAGAVLPGYDFVDHDTDASDDDAGHGTAVASIIAARGDNGVGMAGVCWACRILPVKVTTDLSFDPSSADLAAGIVYAADHEAQIINVSLTGYAPDAVLRDAVAYAQRHGSLVVAAVGDQAVTTPQYPAAFDGVIGVGATEGGDRFLVDRGDGIVYGSNYGEDWVDVGASWANVILATSGFADDDGDVDVGDNDYYTRFTTTEGSAALVSGTLALMKSAAPDADDATLLAALTSTARQTEKPGFRYGEIRAGAAVTAVAAAGGADRTAPKITGVSPAQSTRFRGSVKLSATGVSDSGSGVAYAALYANGTLVGKDTTAPYAVTYASGSRNGKVAFQWRVFDKAGNSAVADRTLIADNKAPTVQITSAPANGAKVKGTVTVKVAASDASNIGRVELIVNGTVVATDTASPYLFKIKVSKYGKKIKVWVRAVDKVGNTATTAARTWKR